MKGPGPVMVPVYSHKPDATLARFPSWGPRSALETRLNPEEWPSGWTRPGGLGGALCSFRVGGWSRAPGPGPPSVNPELGGHCAQGAGLLETRGLPSRPLHRSQASHSPALPPAWQRPLPAQPGRHSRLWAPGAQNSSTALAPDAPGRWSWEGQGFFAQRGLVQPVSWDIRLPT